MTSPFSGYPVTFDVEYPDQQRNPLTCFFRILMVIPIGIVLGLVTGSTIHAGSREYLLGSGGIVMAPTMLMLLFRRKYPRWWFDWNLQLTRFAARVTAYLALLRDEYPSTDEEQAVHVVASVGQMAPGDSPLHRARLADRRRNGRGHRGLVRDSLHGALPACVVRFRGGCASLGDARVGLCLPADD